MNARGPQHDRFLAAAIERGLTLDAFNNPLAAAELWWLGADPSMAARVHARVAAREMQARLERRPPGRSPVLAPGGTVPGLLTWDGTPLCLRSETFGPGCQLLGASGEGKSTLEQHFIAGLAEAGVSVLAVDLKKSQLRNLLGRCPPGMVVVLRPEHLRLNPFAVPAGVDATTYDTDLLKFLIVALRLASLGRVLSRQLLAKLRAGRPATSPATFYDFREAWWAASDRNALARESATERVEALKDELARYQGLWRVREPWPLEALCQPGRVVVLELEELSVPAQQYVVYPTIAALVHRALARRRFEAPVEHVILLDDAGEFLKTNPEHEVDPLTEYAAYTRSLGIAFMVATQTLRELSPRLPAHLAGIKVLLRPADANDAEWLGRTMGMTPEAREAAKRLRRGEAYVQLGQDWPEPFPAHVEPPGSEPRDVCEADVAASRAALLATPVGWADDQPTTFPAHTRRTGRPSRAPETPKATVSEAEVRLLRAVVKEPGLKFTAYPVPSKAAMGMTQATRAREGLKAKRFITVEEEATGGRGAPALVLRPTREGRAFLERVEARNG